MIAKLNMQGRNEAQREAPAKLTVYCSICFFGQKLYLDMPSSQQPTLHWRADYETGLIKLSS